MRGEDVRQIFEAVLPDEALKPLIVGSGMQQRERKLDAVRLVRSAVIASANGGAGRQAAILNAYFESGGDKVVRGAAYGWFSRAFELTMEGVARRALEYARAQPKDLPGVLGRHVIDWHIVDSSTVKLDDDLRGVFPGAGEYAALKVHKRYSVGIGTTIGYHISPAREHDAPHLTLDESWRNHGLLVDLGYASHELLRQAKQYEVRYVMRLKESWKPNVKSIAAGEVGKTFLPGADFDALLDDEVLRLTGASIDADVQLGRGDTAIDARLVGVRHNGSYYYYLTNLPRSVSPEVVAQLYRVRWEIESSNKLDKSCFNLDEIAARTEHTVRALVHASIAAAILVCLIAHSHQLRETRPKNRRRHRTVPPIHVQSLARIVASAADRIAGLFELTGQHAENEWDRVAGVLLHRGTDPNWRRRPSVLDQLRGWIVQPAQSRGGGRKARRTAN
jgi:hypothetical protein